MTSTINKRNLIMSLKTIDQVIKKQGSIAVNAKNAKARWFQINTSLKSLSKKLPDIVPGILDVVTSGYHEEFNQIMHNLQLARNRTNLQIKAL
jgi:hypothetical protein